MANNQLDLGRITLAEGEDLSVLEHLSYDSTNGKIDASKPVVETMSGYDFTPASKANLEIENIYVGAVKNGNKLTLVVFQRIKRTGDIDGDWATLGYFGLPNTVANKIIPYSNSLVATQKVDLTFDLSLQISTYKNSASTLTYSTDRLNTLTLDTNYFLRIEQTYLLSDSLVS